MRKIISYRLLTLAFILIFFAIFFLVPPYPCWSQDVAEQSEDKDNGLSDLTIISDNGDKAQIKLYSTLTIIDAQKLWDDFFHLTHNTKIRDIDIYIASPGGSTFGGFSIIAQIKKSQSEGFHITGYGMAMVGSMAIPILACCDVRIAYASTVFMVHPLAIIQAAQALMKEADMESQAQSYAMSKDIYVSAVAEYTKLSKEEWLEKIKKDTWFSAEQAKEWGLVDIIF